MGYYTMIEGSIRVTPSFTAEEVAELESTRTAGGSLAFDSDGDLAPRWDEPAKYYGIISDVQKFIDAHPDREFTGYFECEGEDRQDVWRLVIRGRLAVEVKGVVTVSFPGE